MRVLKVGLVLLLWVLALTVQAELKFPQLTGRVVDNAAMIEPSVREQLTQQLDAHEKATGEQLVVVTLPDLQGTDIADFGYQLGRHWGIGQKDKNNGALLIVARDERRLRIEVGYGLEERLTDAQSSVIINQVITPAFKAGNFSKGISDGVAAMLVVLGGNPLDEPSTVYESRGDQQSDFVSRHPGLLVFLVMLFILTMFVCQVLGILPSGGGGGRGSSGGGFGGGGFG
ncbi:TPM domain-containing protein, partial [Pseudomonas silesiensis]|uniref:TPM domain-containing protein n=1 Tax=Pseudomonas silesiensis TaxID=1853130 RepID=UPI0034D69ED3